jgi:hypothetical protein
MTHPVLLVIKYKSINVNNNNGTDYDVKMHLLSYSSIFIGFQMAFLC